MKHSKNKSNIGGIHTFRFIYQIENIYRDIIAVYLFYSFYFALEINY